MTTGVAALPVGMSAGEAIEAIRRLHDELEDLSYVYVVDEEERLLGCASPSGTWCSAGPASGSTRCGCRPHRRCCRDRPGRGSRAIQRYHLFGLPVNDGSGGCWDGDHRGGLEVVQEEASEDFAVAVGAGAEETVPCPVPRSIRSRLPWISFDVVISSVVVVAISRFSGILEQFTVLAVSPSSWRASAVTLRPGASPWSSGAGLRRRPQPANARVIRRETLIGCAQRAGDRPAGRKSWAMCSRPSGRARPVADRLAMTIAAWSNLLIAGMAGAGIPLARALGFDLALGSNLFLTTITDLLGFAGFLAVASALLT